MKRIYMYYNKVCLLVVAMLMGTLMMSCERDNEVTPLPKEETEKKDETPTQGEGEDELAKSLAAIPGISNVTVQKSPQESFGYYFDVEQYIDHKNPSLGTFQQRCLLQYVGEDAPVMLYTNGYALDDSLKNIGVHDIASYLGASSLYVEHRYFGHSQPEPLNNIYFTYLSADQAANDLHRVVTLMKQNFFTHGNKWVSTGTSKCGINTTLYAYYSDLYGWDDVDLYVPFCAPFLLGSSQSAGDKALDTYLINVCGTGYPKGSVQDRAYQYLCAYPSAIVNNKILREACLRKYHQEDPANYLRLLKNYPTETEKAATVGVLCDFYAFLFDKFSYINFNRWCAKVPNPTDFDTVNPSLDYRLVEIVEFIFANAEKMEKIIKEDEESRPLDSRRSGYTVDEIRMQRVQDNDMAYEIQAFRELGSVFHNFSLVPADGFVTPEYCDQVSQANIGLVANYGDVYKGQWDGGKLMANVRKWVDTTKKRILFVYGSYDPWTGGAIDSTYPWPGDVEAVNPNNPNTTKVVVPGGTHNHYILNEAYYTPETSKIIKQTLDKYIKGK